MIDPDDELKTGCPLLPVGFPLGEVYNTVERVSYGAIRKGGDSSRIALDEYQTWLYGFDAQSRAELIARCAHEAVPEPEARIGSLVEAGFLVELRDRPQDNHDLFERLRLIPLGFGFGNTPDDPGHFEIGQLVTEEALSLDARVYAVWARSTVPVSIAHACRESASEDGQDPGHVQGRLALSLPALLSHGLVYLDEYVNGHRESSQANGWAQVDMVDGVGPRRAAAQGPSPPLRAPRG